MVVPPAPVIVIVEVSAKLVQVVQESVDVCHSSIVSSTPSQSTALRIIVPVDTSVVFTETVVSLTISNSSMEAIKSPLSVQALRRYSVPPGLVGQTLTVQEPSSADPARRVDQSPV